LSKTVVLNIPVGKKVKLSGSENDRSVIGAIENAQGFYETNVMAELPKLIEAEFVCLDVGANIGALSLAFANLASERHVISIEAGRANFGYLSENIKVNGFKNIKPLNKAVSDYNGYATFNYIETVAGCSFISTVGVVEGEQEIVSVTTIDELVQELRIERLDFLKIDVEGGERRALVGAENTIKKFSPILLVEWNPKTIHRFYEENPKDLFDLINTSWKSIKILRDEEIILVSTYKDLCRLTENGKGWEDLICEP